MRLARLIAIGGTAVWILNAAVWCVSGVPLGHDEARYALDARELLAGHPKEFLYVPPGMNAITAPALWFGGEERALRVLPLAAGVLFLLAAWHLAVRSTDRTTACWVVGVLAGSHPMMRFSAQLMSDLASGACVLASLAIFVLEFTRPDGPTRRVLWTAPLLAAAFYIRYGSAVTIALVGALLLVVFSRAIVRAWRWTTVCALLIVLLLLPYAIYSVKTTGSVLGILVISGKVTGHAGGEGLIAYLTTNPFIFYGMLIAPLMVIGALPLSRDRVTTFLQVVAVGQVIALGFTTHAQPRFVFVASTLLVITAVAALRRLSARFSARAQASLKVVATVAVIAFWVVALLDSEMNREFRVRSSRPTLLAAAAIHRDDKAPCMVVGRQTAQLEWYTGCAAMRGATDEMLAANYVYVVREAGRELTATLSGFECVVLMWPSLVTVSRLQSSPLCR